MGSISNGVKQTAQAFWHKTIDEYTKGKFTEKVVDGGIVQSFMS